MNPADLTLSISPTLTSHPAPTALALAPKAGKAPVPRIDVESIYTSLKNALGEQWTDYKSAISAFILGQLNQAELSWVLQPLLTTIPSVTASASSATSPNSTLLLHNQLLAAIYANTLRDPPPTEIAAWVVATDKPAAATKNAGTGGANDKAEERLRAEVMALNARDRRRIKALKDKDGAQPLNDALGEMTDYRYRLAVKPPDVVPPSAAAGGIAKTNWDLEIRRRYAQRLAGETLEFPTLMDMQNRIEPICYEEGLVGGTASGALQVCAEVMEQATQVFVKEYLGQLYEQVRSNGEGCIQTKHFRRRLRREEEDAEHGEIQRNPAGLLPVEVEMRTKRKALGVEDLRLAVELQQGGSRMDPFLARKIVLGRQPEIGVEKEKVKVNGINPKPMMNGTFTNHDRIATDDTVMTDAEDWTWRGASKAEMNDLINVLDDCLAVG